MVDLKEKARGLPLNPGVYIMMDKTGKVIYVGKAKVLKNRVSSYFIGEHEPKTEAMVSKVASFDIIIANSELEALVLENQLIKHHQPQYNIQLKDAKGMPFIRVDLRAQYPTFSIASKLDEDGAKYLGPYGGRSVTREAIDTVCKALKLPTCGKKFPRDIGKARPCLNFHMGACRAYCRPDASSDEYRESIGAAVAVFEGKTATLIERLQEEMDKAAAELKFEIAAQRRDRLRAVKLLEQKQLVVSGAMADTDIAGYYRGAAKSCFTVLHYIDRRLIGKDALLFDTPIEDDEDAVSGLLRQYYENRGVLPKYIFLPCPVPDAELLEQMFSERAMRRVYIQFPRRGDKAKLVETANINAREETERATTREEKVLKIAEWLQKSLMLDTMPERIEAFDISNTGSSDIVASMTVFVKGKPYKKDYRRFRIKTVEHQDDYHSMAEVISRRIARFLEGDEKFSPLPDIMLIDGGVNHARVALEAAWSAGVSAPVFGMVKDDRHRTRALVTPGGDEIGIVQNPAVFAFIGTIQEETHRFAIEYHRTLRSKNSYGSELSKIKGIGEKRRNALLAAFGSVKAIREAGVDELAKVASRGVAEKIFAYFHGETASDVGDEDI